MVEHGDNETEPLAAHGAFHAGKGKFGYGNMVLGITAEPMQDKLCLNLEDLRKDDERASKYLVKIYRFMYRGLVLCFHSAYFPCEAAGDFFKTIG